MFLGNFFKVTHLYLNVGWYLEARSFAVCAVLALTVLRYVLFNTCKILCRYDLKGSPLNKKGCMVTSSKLSIVCLLKQKI